MENGHNTEKMPLGSLRARPRPHALLTSSRPGKVSPFLESVFLHFVEEISFAAAQVHNLRTAVSVFLLQVRVCKWRFSVQVKVQVEVQCAGAE